MDIVFEGHHSSRTRPEEREKRINEPLWDLQVNLSHVIPFF